MCHKVVTKIKYYYICETRNALNCLDTMCSIYTKSRFNGISLYTKHR